MKSRRSSFLSTANFLALFILFLFAGSAAFADSDYYPEQFWSSYSSGELVDQQLKRELFQILSHFHNPQSTGPDTVSSNCESSGCYRHQPVSYRKTRRVLFGEIHLEVIDGEYAVQDVYCDRWLTASEFRSRPPGPGQIPNNTVINAEHTWPQSKFSSAHSKSSQKSDLHALFPTSSRVNSSRGNIPLGEVGRVDSQICPASARGPSRLSGQTVFEPPNSHKGNAARALFYFSIRYQMNIDDEEEQFLRVWDLVDPVDEFEFWRNDVIHQTQLNRNPFVDIQGLAGQIEDF